MRILDRNKLIRKERKNEKRKKERKKMKKRLKGKKEGSGRYKKEKRSRKGIMKSKNGCHILKQFFIKYMTRNKQNIQLFLKYTC